MKNNNTMNLAPEVVNALKKYNSAIDGALEAVQKLEAISITKHLAEYFWVKEDRAAHIIRADYVAA